MITAGIIGATGYAGAELVRLLSCHPKVDALSLSSTSFEGGTFDSVYPAFFNQVTATLEKPEAVIAASDVVFSALPHGVGEAFAIECWKAGKLFIDISADFRFGEDEATFKAWYKKDYADAELHLKAVYGSPEMNRESIVGAKLISNPGCYVTSASLGCYPALAKGLAAVCSGDTHPIIVNAVSGVTGAGRNPTQTTHYTDCADSFSAYALSGHRHLPEIARNLKQMAGKAVPLLFTPHLAPINRGILSTIYIPLAQPVGQADPCVVRPASAEIEAKTAEIQALYAAFYKDEPFVKVLPVGQAAQTRYVRGSNYCCMSVHVDPSGTTLIVLSAVDNMVKGAAGQAIQNMNISLGYPEDAGIGGAALSF